MRSKQRVPLILCPKGVDGSTGGAGGETLVWRSTGVRLITHTSSQPLCCQGPAQGAPTACTGGNGTQGFVVCVAARKDAVPGEHSKLTRWPYPSYVDHALMAPSDVVLYACYAAIVCAALKHFDRAVAFCHMALTTRYSGIY
ncbi:hypothetical protein HK100_011763 [Physocladia obscura]|uniref:Uncharacterized protein n=1 Tax=Physocladia obscura TaxID=109957 RepID=A0AAD5T3A5_9FUNG|nr:hypothetical protein HK100_011763 [Physocladia obscura]